MAEYKLADGTALPTSQFADYQKSVHYAALTKGNDLSAPTCNDCHGNHGAAPPGVGAVANVCGTCHAVFATKFQTSVHAQIFDKGCVECHSNHTVLKPSDDMLGSSGNAVCATCHSGADDNGAVAADRMRRGIEALKLGIGRSGELIARVSNAGIEMSNAGAGDRRGAVAADPRAHRDAHLQPCRRGGDYRGRDDDPRRASTAPARTASSSSGSGAAASRSRSAPSSCSSSRCG